MRIHSELKQCKCDSCGADFLDVQDVRRHQKVAHVVTGAYKCSKCSCQFERHVSLARHMGRRHHSHTAEQRLMR
jgi:DNA-directed RNA polymerase subunit RPC12/RpoP